MNVWFISVQHFWKSGGTLMPALFLLAFVICYLSLSLYIPLAQITRHIKKLRVGTDRTCKQAVHADKENLRKRQLGELQPYDRDLRILRALVAASPLVGLLGTVKGMIATFITLSGHGNTSMELLAIGISEALITTQVGLIIAIPGLVGIHASARKLTQLKNLFDRLRLHAEVRSCISEPTVKQVVAQ